MDPVTGSLIVGGVGALAGLAGSGATNSANEAIADKNIALARETNAKNEALMRESWAREDNAVQRRAKDLTMAGMSPLLAAGASAQAGQVVSYKAPESHQTVQRSGLEGAISGIYQGIMAQQSFMDMMARQQQILINQGSLALQREQQSNATAESMQRQRMAEIGLKYEDRLKLASLAEKQLQNATSNYNLDLSNKLGLRTTEQQDHLVKKVKAVVDLAQDTAGKAVNQVNDFTGRNATIQGLFEYGKKFRK